MRKWVWVMFPFWFFSGVTACFEEGYPGGDGPVESDVGFQLLFDEATGPFVDEVAGVNITAAIDTAFQVPYGGRFRHLSPGATVNSAYFENVNPVAGLQAGLGPFTHEFWVVASSGVYNLINLDPMNAVGPAIGINTTGVTVTLGDLDTFEDPITYTYAWPSSPFGSTPFKVSVRSDRNTMEVYLNETLIESKDISATSGWDLRECTPKLGGPNYPLTFLEYRFSKNATNNSTPVWIP